MSWGGRGSRAWSVRGDAIVYWWLCRAECGNQAVSRVESDGDTQLGRPVDAGIQFACRSATDSPAPKI